MRVLVVVLAAVAALLVQSPAHADVTGSIDAEPQQALGGCARYDFDYDLNVPPGMAWQATVYVYESGQVDDLFYEMKYTLDSTRGDAPSGTLETQRICDFEDPVGRYAVSMEGTYSNALNVGAIRGQGVVVVKPAKTRTSVTASTRSPRFNQPVRLTVQAEVKKEYGWGPVWAADVKAQIRARGKWVNAPKLDLVTARNGRDNWLLRWNIHQPVTMRFVFPKQDMYAASVSKPITINARG